MTQQRSSESESEPLWREEFSIDATRDKFVSRRQFTKFLTLTSFAMLVGNCWILAKSFLRKHIVFPRTAVARLEDVPIGEVKIFRYPTEKDPCILIRTAVDKAVAYSQKCTHLACPVFYSKEHQRLECPCHEGVFSVETGDVISGPPPRPLPSVILENQDGMLIATGLRLSDHD